VQAYMRHVMDNAEESVRRVIDRIGDGSFAYTMDDGSPLHVAITVDHRSRAATVDFTGTGAQRDDNFNAPPAVTRSAVLYALRCLVGSDIPLNDGCLKPIRLVIPPGTSCRRSRERRWWPATPRRRKPLSARCSAQWRRRLQVRRR
jgi:5-oxoprolinase (ATP-hydrolysing)